MFSHKTSRTALLFGTILTITITGVCHPALPDELDESITKHRMGQLIVTAPEGTMVQVEQLRHEFWFGAAISNGAFDDRMTPEDTTKYKEAFLDNFNSAVTENALKWHSMQRNDGRVDYRTVDAMLDWTDENDIPLRGHNIYWGVPNSVQPWLKNMDDRELYETLKNRGQDIGRRYRGRFAEYDLNNEMIHANYYADRLGEGITREMADWVIGEDPSAKLYLNDYDILTGNQLDKYIRHIKKLQEQGVRIDGIGVQGHLHSDTFEPEALQNALDRLAEFKLPIRITEFNMPGQRSPYYKDRSLSMTPEAEHKKARQLAEYYRICFAHPAVDGILMWGFWEGANWIPSSSLYKKDWTPTPAARAYRELVFDQWWTETSATVGESGKLEIPAFYGIYRVTINGNEKTVELKSDENIRIIKTY